MTRNRDDVTDQEWLAQQFESHRTHLRAVAYRMLGSLAEADDAVQEAWIRLSRTDTSDVDNLRAVVDRKAYAMGEGGDRALAPLVEDLHRHEARAPGHAGHADGFKRSDGLSHQRHLPANARAERAVIRLDLHLAQLVGG